MNQNTSLYIKKLIGLTLVVIASLFAADYVELYALIPLALIVYSTIYSQIMNKKPPYLFGLKKVDDFITKKGGFWNLFKLILTILGFIYDIVIWVIWSVYLIFEIGIDIIMLIKEIIYWIIHAIIWFLKQFVPAIVFIYKMFLYYIVGWLWWIYRVSFRHVASSVKLNFFLVGLWGSIISIFAVLLFYYLDVLFGTNQLVFIGIVLATLPLAWTYGEIAAINENELQDEPYYEVTSNFQNGVESVKYILYYVVGFLVLSIIHIGLDLFGWIPNVGLTILGFALNINTLISLVLIFLYVIIIFATAIIPTHLLKTEEQETPFHDIINFLSVILKKGLQYILVTIPNAIFGALLMVIPALLVIAAIWITFTVKDDVLQRRINKLEKLKTEEITAVQSYKIDKKIDKLNYYIDFPAGIVEDTKDRKTCGKIIEKLNQYIEDQNAANTKIKVEYNAKLKDLEYDKEEAKKIKNIDRQLNELESIENSLAKLKEKYAEDISNGEFKLKKHEADIQYWKNRKRQLPISLFFVFIWVSLFGGLILAIYRAFLGNVYYELYTLKSEGLTYFSELVKETKEKDRTQPLLGFTLLVIAILVICFCLNYCM